MVPQITERIRKTYRCTSVCFPFFLRTHWLEWSHWTWFADKNRTCSVFKRNGKTETEGIRRHFSIFCRPIEVNGSVYCQYTELKKLPVYGPQNTVVCKRPKRQLFKKILYKVVNLQRYFSHPTWVYVKIHPKTHCPTSPEYGDTTCVQLFCSLGAQRGPNSNEYL